MSSVANQKKLKTQDWPIKKTKKTQGQISIPFRQISGENRTFPEKKPTFPKEISFYPPKFLITFFFFFFFLVITSHFNIFHPHFSNLYHFSPKMSDFLQKTTKINVFSAKFSKNPRKTQGLFENPRKNPRPSEKTQEPKIASENPRSWEKTQAVATLVGRRYSIVLKMFYHWLLSDIVFAKDCRRRPSTAIIK